VIYYYSSIIYRGVLKGELKEKNKKKMNTLKGRQNCWGRKEKLNGGK